MIITKSLRYYCASFFGVGFYNFYSVVSSYHNCSLVLKPVDKFLVDDLLPLNLNGDY